MNPINTGIVGFGISSQVFHAPFIHVLEEFSLNAFVERNNDLSAKAYPGTKTYRSLEDMLQDPAIELVIITTPNETHFPYAAAALKAGKHVVVEKPFTNNSEEAKQLIDISGESGKILTIYHNRRYVSDFFTFREILEKKLLGEVHEFVAHYDRYRPEARPNAWREAPKAGSGIFFDLGSHLVDQALILFGMPKAVTADIRMQRPHARVDDFFEIWLDYGFLKVTLHSGMLVREMGPRYMIHGTEGSYIKYGEDPQEAALRAGQLPVGENWGKEDSEFDGILHTNIDGTIQRMSVPTKPGNFGLYFKDLYQTIRNGAPLKVTPEQGFNTIKIIELAIQSSKEKRSILVS